MENQNSEQNIGQRFQRQKQKFQKMIIRHKDDFLTTLEKNWRDALLKPLTFVFYKIGLRANHITFLGFRIIL